MNYPAFLAPLAIIIWGWLDDNHTAAATLLLLLVLNHVTAWRWQITEPQFFRIGDFISLLIITILIYSYVIRLSDRPIFIVLEWLPLFYAPALFAQLFSVRNKLPLGTLFYSLRKRPQPAIYEVDFRLPYAGICLLAAGAANIQTPVYFLLSATMIVLVLWSAKTPQTTPLVWLLLIGSACFISYEGYHGLHRFQTQLEKQIINWLSDRMPDPYSNRTSIGDIGVLKLSDKIQFRVKSDLPVLLHQVSYDRYLDGTWYASVGGFKLLNPTPAADAGHRLSILQTFRRSAVLALPPGTVSISGLEQSPLYVHPLGAVKVNNAPDYAEIKVSYTDQFESAVGKFDLMIPEFHKAWLKKIAPTVNLQGSPLAVAKNITDYFQRNYRYSLYSDKRRNADQALLDFVLSDKSGHCEYFAAATVFLLRYAGVPARLANGYAVSEYDADQQFFLVRSRHAHAWAWAYIDGHWHAVDSTPSQWLEMENRSESFMQPFYDRLSNWVFRFKQWRQQKDGKLDNSKILSITLTILLVILIWRLLRNRSQLIKTRNIRGDNQIQRFAQGMDSDFYLIEQQFKNGVRHRRTGESFLAWVTRLADPELSRLCHLHLRYRFDPKAITESQRKDLQQSVLDWLKNNGNYEY